MKRNNQPIAGISGKVDIGEETQPGWNMWGDAVVVPMEITLIDNGRNIFVLCEFIDYMNSYIF